MTAENIKTSWVREMFDPTLNGVMAQVDAGKIVLPAMQRPFVWNDDRIAKLIDSLLRGFPLGTTLLWKTATIQRFRRVGGLFGNVAIDLAQIRRARGGGDRAAEQPEG